MEKKEIAYLFRNEEPVAITVMKQYMSICGALQIICARIIGEEVKKDAYTEIPKGFVGACCFLPEESFIREEIMLLQRELSLLRDKYRRIMISYYYIRGQACEEIANKYNLSVSNVKQYLYEGRKKLKEGMDMLWEYEVSITRKQLEFIVNIIYAKVHQSWGGNGVVDFQ